MTREQKNMGIVQVVCAIVGIIVGFYAAQEAFILMHPTYVSQWSAHWNWILIHQHLSMSAMIRRNASEQFHTMRFYLIAGSLLGFAAGIVVPIFAKEWIRQRLAA